MLLLNCAFAADRTTTNLLGAAGRSSSGSCAAAKEPKRKSSDGIPLRTLRLETPGAGMRRSISFNYPLLAAAATGFGEASSAADRLAAVQPAPA